MINDSNIVNYTPFLLSISIEMANEIFAQGIVPGLILIAYLLIVKYIDSKKKDPLKDIAKLLNVVTKDIIDRDRQKSLEVIDVIIEGMLGKLFNYFVGVVINNNIEENREQIEYNSEHIVKSLYSQAFNKLNIYKGNDKYLSYFMKEEWKTSLIEDIINILYNNKLDKHQRIIAFSKRMEIRETDFIAHITNNAFGNK